MDAETQGMSIQLLVTRDAPPGERAELQVELLRRWRAYLRFYPYWADLVDEEEREARRRRAAAGVSVEELCEESDDADMPPREHVLSDQARPRRPTLGVRITCDPRFPAWVVQYCSACQARYMLAYLREPKSERAIAQEHGVSQQAVSAAIRRGLRALKNGLVRDRLADEL